MFSRFQSFMLPEVEFCSALLFYIVSLFPSNASEVEMWLFLRAPQSDLAAQPLFVGDWHLSLMFSKCKLSSSL